MSTTIDETHAANKERAEKLVAELQSMLTTPPQGLSDEASLTEDLRLVSYQIRDLAVAEQQSNEKLKNDLTTIKSLLSGISTNIYSLREESRIYKNDLIHDTDMTAKRTLYYGIGASSAIAAIALLSIGLHRCGHFW